MSTTGKKAALLAVLALFAVALFRYLGKIEADAVNTVNQQSAVQYQEFLDKQSRASSEQMERIAALNDKVEKQQGRYDAILTRWERQADRFDKVLDVLERPSK